MSVLESGTVAETHAPPAAGASPRALAGTDRVVVPSPGMLRNGPRARRGLLHELLDAFCVPMNRCLGRIGWMRALRRSSLRRVEVTDVPLAVDRRHAGLDGLRIAFLSDLHAGSYGGSEELSALFARTMALRPDLVCLGGDLINTRADELELFDEPLLEMRPPLGVFAVPGNHDHRHYPDMGGWQEYLEARGVHVLANHGARLLVRGSSLWLCGVDDLGEGLPDLRGALKGRFADEPTVVLAHQPDHFPLIAPEGVDLVLSGHTHGGQIKLFGRPLVSHTSKGFVEGEFRDEEHGARLWVSRGAGVTLLPLRIGARSEITLVRVRAN
jgi:predicted MPP superfamily phosphohydrolase